MAENSELIPDPQKRAELKAYAEEREAKAAKAKEESFRAQALAFAVQWSSTGNWSGPSAGVVAAAQVFEHYLVTGRLMDKEPYAEVYQAMREAHEAARG